MSDLSLVMLTALVAGALVIGFAGLPWLRAVRAGRVPPRHVLGEARALRAAALMAACLIGCVWLALDAASAGGLLGQRPLAEQMIPVAVAVVLGGCLVLFAWQPDWVARELRGVAIALVVLAGALLAVSGAAGAATAVAALAAAAACLVSSRMLRQH
jgi:hypothetical protein